MTTSGKTKKYPRNVLAQAEKQLAGFTGVDDLLKMLDVPASPAFTFRNLDIFFEDVEHFTFGDLHLLLETISNEMPSLKNYGSKIYANFNVVGVFADLLSHADFGREKEADICMTFLKGTGHFKGFQAKLRSLRNKLLDEKPNTKIDYMYRCACNYKSHEEIVVPGHLALGDIHEDLIDYTHFIAHQIGLSAPQDELHMDPQYDHVLCEMLDIEFTDDEPTTEVTAKELTRKFNKVKWDFEEAVGRYGL